MILNQNLKIAFAKASATKYSLRSCFGDQVSPLRYASTIKYRFTNTSAIKYRLCDTLRRSSIASQTLRRSSIAFAIRFDDQVSLRKRFGDQVSPLRYASAIKGGKDRGKQVFV
jgi:hypothetical protein